MAYREIDIGPGQYLRINGDVFLTVNRTERPNVPNSHSARVREVVKLGVVAPPGVLIGRPEWLERKAKRDAVNDAARPA